MMEKDWTGIDGYPCTFPESEPGKDLTNAILKLPCDPEMTRDDAEQKAYFLWRMREMARYDAQPALRSASQIASEKELRQLFDLCEKLVDHINSMRAPAVSALSREGFLLWELERKLRETQEGARIAFGEVEGEKVRGRTPHVVASQVGEQAGHLYEHVTGRRPTATTDPQTGRVSGQWPDFLSAVFDAFAIKASVASQARAVSEKMRFESTD